MSERYAPGEKLDLLRRTYYARKRDAEEALKRASSYDDETEIHIADILGDSMIPGAVEGQTIKAKRTRQEAAQAAARRAEDAGLILAKEEIKRKKDVEEAFGILNELANKNNTKAILEFATLFEQGDIYEKDAEKARECLEWADELGDGEADFRLGRFYRLGIGVKASAEQASYYFEKAASRGVKRAEYQLADIYFEQERPQAAVKKLQMATLHNVPGAKYDYAMCLLYGEGVKADVRKAVQLLEELAYDGDQEALHKLEFMYSQGFKVKPNRERAQMYRRLISEEEE